MVFTSLQHVNLTMGALTDSQDASLELTPLRSAASASDLNLPCHRPTSP